MVNRLKDKVRYFALGCLSFSTPKARVTALGIGLFILCFVDIAKIGLPDFCLWEKIFGFCPAHGSLRALNAFFRGRVQESIGYNINILITAPLILFIFIKDLFYMLRLKIENPRRL
ncbi:MAG: DUF2752 domain-containing protein [Candidatus Omnitrophota bacterium]|nr:DUF2752 domain-containing protein [Candidatus Omnitrophota bacterium]